MSGRGIAAALIDPDFARELSERPPHPVGGWRRAPWTGRAHFYRTVEPIGTPSCGTRVPYRETDVAYPGDRRCRTCERMRAPHE